MLKSDALSQLKQLKQDIKASRNLQYGTVKGTGNKFGFVTLDAGRDVYLPPDEMQKVIPGDRVEVEVKKDDKKKTIAVIERLLESSVKVFYGKYVTRGKAHFVEADIPGMTQWFFIPPAKRGGAKAHDLVKCRVTQHPLRSGKAQAAINAIIGNEKEPGIEWAYAISKFDIKESWDQQVEQELSSIDAGLISAAAPQREDLRELAFVTIDSRSTTDMDDALWAEKNDEGWLLRVAIADPCALVPAGSAIERAVYERATSIYMPGQHIPMLPTRLAADLGSLVEGEDRLVKVVELQVRADGSLGNQRVFNGIINSRRKLSYGEVASVLNDEESDLDEALRQELKCLKSLADQLRQWRAEYALLHEGRTEFFIEIGENRKISAIKEKILTPAHMLVEECMVAANRCVAQFLIDNQIPAVFVRHQGLREDRIKEAESLLEDTFEDSSARAMDTLEAYQACFRRLNESPEYRSTLVALSKQLEKSYVAGEPGPHFGMGLPYYTTFTSPLRKANDFLLHRQVDNWLSSQAQVDGIDENLLSRLDERWLAARNASNEVEQWLKCQFMANNSDVHEAEIVRCFATGFQVRLLANGIEGFVSTKEMEGKFSFDQLRLRIQGKQHTFELEQKVKVCLKQIDWRRKQIQFALADQ